MIDSLSIAVYAFISNVSMFFSVDETCVDDFFFPQTFLIFKNYIHDTELLKPVADCHIKIGSFTPYSVDISCCLRGII